MLRESANGMLSFLTLERIAHRKMEFAVALELGMQQGPMLLTTGGIVGLHTHINTHKEILEIQADTGTIGCCNLLIELVELEHTARLVFIASDGPDVTGIKEQAQLNDPEQLGTIPGYARPNRARCWHHRCRIVSQRATRRCCHRGLPHPPRCGRRCSGDGPNNG